MVYACFFCIITVYNFLVIIGGNKVAWTTSLLFATCWCLKIQLPNMPWGIDEALMHHMPFVCIGHIFSEIHFCEKIRDNEKIKNCVLVGLLFVSYIFVVYGLKDTHLLGYFGAVIGISMWAVISISFENGWKGIAKIGQASIVIMGLQGPVYDFFIKGYGTILGISREECLRNEIHAFVGCTATVAICYAVYILINNKVPWILKTKKE